MRVTAVRHGQTFGNIDKLIQSRSDGKLTDLGVSQAQAAALALKDDSFDAIYCSTLGRCKETLAQIMIYHNEGVIQYTPQLVELDKGDYEGKHWDELPEYFYTETNIDVRSPGGESWRDLEKRLISFLNTVFKSAATNVLLVTHDGPLKVIHSLLDNIPLGEAVGVSYSNAGIYRFEMLDLVHKNGAE